MALLLLAPSVADAIKNADAISMGLESGPIRYIAALSLLANVALFGMVMRVQALRVRELKEEAVHLKEEAIRSQALGGILEKHSQATAMLDRMMEKLARMVEISEAKQPKSRRAPEPQPHSEGEVAKP